MIYAKLARILFRRNADPDAPKNRSGMLRFAPYLLIIPIIVFLSLSLTGCVSTSPAIPDIYIVSLRPNNNATDSPQVRIGYFGICGIDATGTTHCQSASGRTVDTLVTNLFNATTSNTTSATSDNSTVTDLVSTALSLQSHIFISVLAGAAVLFVLGLAALFLFKRDVRSPSSWEHPARSTIVRRTTYALLFGSAALVFAAALATSESGGALEFATADMQHASVLIHAGKTLQVLQWVAFGFELLFALAVPFLARYREPVAQEGFKGEA